MAGRRSNGNMAEGSEVLSGRNQKIGRSKLIFANYTKCHEGESYKEKHKTEEFGGKLDVATTNRKKADD